jgi:hypothetical protein
MRAWIGWYHCMGNTYGTWLPGDERGFRTRHQRWTVPFDYKHRPPEGTYDAFHAYSKRKMKRDPVYLETMKQRERIRDEFVASLQRRNLDVAIFGVDRVHFHLLACFPDHDPRRWVGIAKREASHYCKQTGDAPAGGLWSAATECKPIKDQGHWFAVRNYIADHRKQGAAIFQGIESPVHNPLAGFDPNDLLID